MDEPKSISEFRKQIYTMFPTQLNNSSIKVMWHAYQGSSAIILANISVPLQYHIANCLGHYEAAMGYRNITAHPGESSVRKARFYKDSMSSIMFPDKYFRNNLETQDSVFGKERGYHRNISASWTAICGSRCERLRIVDADLIPEDVLLGLLGSVSSFSPDYPVNAMFMTENIEEFYERFIGPNKKFFMSSFKVLNYENV